MTTEQGECGWLIETGDHKYWDGRYADQDGFTGDANEAVRFARRIDADRVIYWLLSKYSVFLCAREHKWLAERSE